MSDLKEDFLEVDRQIPGQNFVCLSFVSPEKVLKQKNMFYLTKFLHHLFTDNTEVTKEIRTKMSESRNITYDYTKEVYEDWIFNRKKDLELEFYEEKDFTTTMRGVKVRGVYDTLREAKKRAQILQRRDRAFHVFVGQVGYWLPWDPECNDVNDQEYQEGQLNELMKKYKENIENRDVLYDKLREEKIENARKELARRKKEQEEKRRLENEKELIKTDTDNVAQKD